MTAALCAAILALFAILSWSAASTKGHTFDEPLHGLGAWVNLRFGDFRIAYEHPPLWKYWLALPNGREAMRADFEAGEWRDMPREPSGKWLWAVRTLYRTPGNDANRFIARERAMMLVFGVLLGALIAWWAWRLGGAAAAVCATALFAFDPNFLGHSPLIKNDVIVSLVLLATMYVVWRMGERVTVGRVIAFALLCGAGLNIKFSAVLFAPVAGAALLCRALLPQAWPVLGRELRRRASRVAAVVGVIIFAGAVSVFTIWACYLFRFAPTPDRSILLDTSKIVGEIAAKESGGGSIERDPAVAALRFCESHRLLPQAWIAGVLYTRQLSLGQPVFLLDELNTRGWWYYFPVAALVKTPVATQVILILAAAGIVYRFRRGLLRDPARRWTAICLALPWVVYGVALAASRMDMGLRYALPLYPLMFVAASVMIARLWEGRLVIIRALLVVLLTALAIESAAAFPNYIDFFNIGVGGPRGGLHLLGDSNLDWGQDLPLLARWQQQHPNEKLYLCYFGREDPAYLGIRYTNLPGGYKFGPPFQWPREPGVIAVSATQLQGIYLSPELRVYYAKLRDEPPIEVLGGTIYLYQYR